MKISATLIFVYGLIILIGGFIGHMKAASTASLVMGVIFGLLLLLSSVAVFRGKAIGEYAALLLTFLLDAFFTYRFLTTRQFMPSGLLCLLSLLVLFLLAFILKNRQKKTGN
jgi:uncharacterized membrane protein (UPF0136 family)